MATVLLTGAGGVAMPSVIEHLRRLGHRVIACDMDKHAAGLYFADKGYIIPRADSPEFLPALRRVCQQEGVQVVVPLVDEEILSALELEQDGIRVLAPRPEFVALCRDKLHLMRRLKEAAIPMPRTLALDEVELEDWDIRPFGFATILKPRTGRGSRYIYRVESAADVWKHIRANCLNWQSMLLQDYIDGPEYTVSVVVWRDGEVQAVVPKESLCRRSSTHIGVTRRNEQIDDLCRRIQRELRADGPFNVQLRIDQDGIPRVFEINPRYAGSTTLTLAAGCDEIGGLIAQAVGGRAAYRFGEWQEDVVLLRRVRDTFTTWEKFRECQVEQA